MALPSELRLLIFENLITPGGAVDVDYIYAVRTAGKSLVLATSRRRIPLALPKHISLTHRLGSRATAISCTVASRLVNLRSARPDALSLILTNKQLYREVADLLYTSTVFKVASLEAFVLFLDTLGPMAQAALATLELNVSVQEATYFDNSETYNTLCNLTNLTNLKSLVVAIDSHVLDVVAVRDEHFRTRFAAQLAPPGHWWSDESIDLADKHLDCLRQIAWGIISQAEDAAGKRERFKILKITRRVGASAKQRAALLTLDRYVLQSDDYDEIEATVLPMIEQELEEGGFFA